ncbi:MAG: phosphoenolpyruvate carboxylase [Gemmatimonadales bacterium]|nr:MAG: phosphoenolpyruvate carboxylase [Gemmatimonadales bacterium]
MTGVDQERLRDEIRWLGEELGHVLREQAGEGAFDLVEEVRALARARREGEEGAEDRLLARLESLEPGAAEPLIGALSVFFDLANLAEDRQRVRVVRERERAGSTASGRGEGTVADAVRMLREWGLGAEAVQALLDDTGVEFVFTAHPTEAKRRSVREKIRDLRGHLYDLDDPGLLPRESRELEAMVRADLTGLWMTDFVRFRRPTVLEELDRSLFFAGNLWAAAPRLFRELRVALEASYPGHDFRIPSLVRFGTWIGGDRDGNPFVTAQVTRASLARLREEALTRHIEQARLTRRSLSMSLRKAGASDSLLEAIGKAVAASPSLAEAVAHLSKDEPYRRWLAIVESRLRRALEAGVDEDSSPGSRRGAEAYEDPRELVRDLKLMRESLVAHGGSILADAHVDDWICQAEVFGFSLMRLDVRQESGRYHDDLAEILAYLGIHDGYGELDEEGRRRVLSDSMPCRAPLDAGALSDEARETVALFDLLAAVCRRSGPGSLGAHVISMTHRPSDVLAVLWLSRWAAARAGLDGERLPVPIAPLFETIDDLASSAETLELLFEDPAYREELDALGGRQMVMVGYSDSTKDGGYLAAAWNLFHSQSRMQAAAEAHGVPLVFFHGRGGALGRGGGPAARHIRSLPPATLRAGLRITEQGEVLAERYDDRRVAGRHLQQMLSAVLEGGGRALLPGPGGDEVVGAAGASHAEPELPEALFESLARTSREAYRTLVDHPGFIRYFEEATPIQGIEDLPIGSRPARRGGQRSLSSLRAIPWVFSWTQSRHMLPAWYGLGSAVEAVARGAGGEHADPMETLRDLYRTSSFFRATIDNAELALAKADMGIARIHGRLVEDAEVRRQIGEMIEAEFARSRAAVLALTGQAELLDQVPWLKRSIQVRNPYVDPLNLLQVTLFRRLRTVPEGSEAESDARELIRLTIQGISGGLRTTG